MEKFKKIYNRECTNAINEGWEGFLIPEGVFVDFFDRNKKMIKETMKDEIDDYMKGFGVYGKLAVTVEYLWRKLHIYGTYYKYKVHFHQLELID